MSTKTQAPAAHLAKGTYATAIILVAVGWVALLAATGMNLLEAMQVEGIGVGALLTAITITLLGWRR